MIDYEKLYEIRLRTGRPVFLCYGDGEKFLRTGNGMPYRVTRQDLERNTWSISVDILFMLMKMKYVRAI
mgnify:CR=1 FL=1